MAWFHQKKLFWKVTVTLQAIRASILTTKKDLKICVRSHTEKQNRGSDKNTKGF